jgi:dissimilatory sulfite reductase (desulfoviridin) alpha/beta subunit
VTSPFLGGVYALHDLTFIVYGPPYVVNPATGNDEPTESAVVVRCKLKEANASLRAQLGVDEQELLLEGRCVEPMALPDGVVAGSIAALAVGGRVGRARLLPQLVASIPAVEAALGKRVLLAWRG